MTIRAQALPAPSQPPPSGSGAEYPDHLQDASCFRGKADRIFFPVTEGEIAWILRQASKEKKPVTVSGGGTGLTGARVPQGGILLCTERMNKILQVDWDPTHRQGRVLLEAGVSLKELEEALDPKGLFYPPDPGERAALIGGTVATNASGPRSFKYGPTRRYVRRLRVVLAHGDLLDIPREQEKAQGGTFTLILSNGKSVNIPLPTYSSPKVKNAAGYFSQAEMDLVDLFVGSEGTLGVVTQVELDLLKKPEAVLSGILFFDSEQDCFLFAMAAKRMSPRVLEFFDSKSLTILSRKHDDIPQKAGAALYFQQECEAGEEGTRLREWARRAEAFHARPADCWFSHRPEDHQVFRNFRYDLPVLVNEEVARSGFRKLGTDLAVPDAQAKEMFDFYRKEVPQVHMEYAIWGHLGENHLHVNLFPRTEKEFERAKTLYGTLAKKAVELGGTVSAEHGIGKVRIPYLELMVGREGLTEMARVKKALDPDGILSPGNIFPVELLKEV